MVPLLAIVYFGGIALTLAAILIALIGVKEFFNGFENMGVKPSKSLAYAMIGVLYLLHFSVGKTGENYMLILSMWTFAALVASFVYGWKITERGPYDSMATAVGLVYIVLFSYHIVLLDITAHKLVWLVILSAFGSDIFAYFTGYFFGKHKMAPNLSPKKTVEGGIGGVVGAAFLCFIFGRFVMPEFAVQCLLIGIVGGLAGEAGDLTASAFKRKMEIKDYGNLIPGHGGIMDRFDSVIFVAPVIYYTYIIITFL